MRRRRAELTARNAEVLVLSFGTAGQVGELRDRHDIPFTLLIDERRSAYRAYGLGRASWLRMLTPRTLAPYIRLALTTRGVPRSGQSQDKQQMGGDFLVDPAGQIALAHASHDPADRPDVGAFLAAIDAAERAE